MSDLFALGPEPKWLTCSCGELTSRVPCWTCSHPVDSVDHDERECRRAGIPMRFKWARLTHPELAQRVKSSLPIAEISRLVLAANHVVFAGTASGAGKTSLAVACLRERVPHALFVSAIRLGTARIQTHAGQGEAPLVERAIEAPLLLIDEVGGEQKTATNAVRDVLFARHDADLPTWITTGFTGKQLAEMYGDGFFRRLSEGAYVAQLGGAK